MWKPGHHTYAVEHPIQKFQASLWSWPTFAATVFWEGLPLDFDVCLGKSAPIQSKEHLLALTSGEKAWRTIDVQCALWTGLQSGWKTKGPSLN